MIRQMAVSEDNPYGPDEVFKMIQLCEKTDSIDMFLETPVCHTGFKRIN